MLSGLNVEGNTILHRMPVSWKLGLLLLSGIILFFVSSLAILVPAFILSAAIYFTTGLAFTPAWRRLLPVFLTLLVLVAFTAWVNSPREASEVFFRLMTVVFLAGAVTATTETGAFIDTITALFQPLDRLGLVRAADIGLAFGLVLRFAPDILSRYQAIRDAHRARGQQVRLVSIIGPLVILTLRDADTIAMAIDARGFRRSRTGTAPHEGRNES